MAWCQLTRLLRNRFGLLALLGWSLFILASGFIGGGRDATTVALPALMLSFIAPFLLQADFRGDLDHLEKLKSLPLQPLAVAAGELAVPVALTTAAQFAFLFVVQAVLGGVEAIPAWAALYVPPVNLVIFGTQNLLFLLFPARMASATAGDLQHFGRVMVLFFFELVALFVLLAVAGACGFAALFLFRSQVALVVGSLGVLLVMALGSVPAVAWAWKRFDVALDTPA